MKKCQNYETCNNMCGDNYKYCEPCYKEWEKEKPKKKEQLKPEVDLIQKINWNIGAATKYLRLYFLHQICSEMEGHEPFKIKEKIYKIFKQNIEKDFKHLDDIEKELKKKQKDLYSLTTYLPTMELKCKRCKHKWNYKGKSEWYATCPKCLNKVRIKKVKNVKKR